ncbi:hypothetical protein VIGAN_01110000 [Vigna angularis var. angularis]|uniref:Uncharacterized protein n=1 Tax=Vigna angularis var. angularis TaxID=157739 RepID=A0A0S3QZ23_PHAAN|nr:hypothetical protein VIGAN_01110000 [Vigna angularis var. angularis]
MMNSISLSRNRGVKECEHFCNRLRLRGNRLQNFVILVTWRGITLKLEACFDDAFFPIFNHKIPSTQGSSIAGGRDSGAAVLRFPITGDDLHRSEHDLLQVPLSDSSSSSEADELEGVPAATYCMWTGFRAGCVGFVGGEGREFRVVGAYGG